MLFVLLTSCATIVQSPRSMTAEADTAKVAREASLNENEQFEYRNGIARIKASRLRIAGFTVAEVLDYERANERRVLSDVPASDTHPRNAIKKRTALTPQKEISAAIADLKPKLEHTNSIFGRVVGGSFIKSYGIHNDAFELQVDADAMDGSKQDQDRLISLMKGLYAGAFSRHVPWRDMPEEYKHFRMIDLAGNIIDSDMFYSWKSN